MVVATCLCSLIPRPSLPPVEMRLCSTVVVCLRHSQNNCPNREYLNNFEIEIHVNCAAVILSWFMLPVNIILYIVIASMTLASSHC